jgi:hypothetical protein
MGVFNIGKHECILDEALGRTNGVFSMKEEDPSLALK